MIKHPVHGTLNEFLNKIEKRIEDGRADPSCGMILTWFAEQYRIERSKPAEPGARIPPSLYSLTLAQIDELRELNARGEHKALASRLEELARERSINNSTG